MRTVRRLGAVATVVAAVAAGPTLLPAERSAAAPAPRTAAVTAEPLGAQTPVSRVDLHQLVADLAATMPGRGSEGYDVPSAAEAAALADAYRAMATGDVRRATRLARPLSYDVSQVVDGPTGRVLLLLAERRGVDGRYAHGWGLFVHDPSSTAAVAIEVTHPVADLDTETLGVALFRATGARSLLVAGAHRAANADDSADVAHAAGSVFEAVHREVLAAGVRVVQPHGFSADGHPHLPTAVVSAGTATGSPLSRRLTALLGELGVTACTYATPGCDQLGGTTNTQGRSTRKAGGDFLHLELARTARVTGDAYDAVVSGVRRALAP